MHCHVAWHASEGFAVQFVEREKKISGLMDAGSLGVLKDTCTRWNGGRTSGAVRVQDDSGI